MPSSYTCLYYHAIFSTKNRIAQIDPTIQTRLYEYIGGTIRDNKGRLLAAGGMPDHIHLLFSSHPSVAISDLMRELKSGSSGWVHDTFANHDAFAWQDGYGAFTVSLSNLDRVKHYIDTQQDHHRTKTFQEEFIDFLQRHGVEYDERYIWS